MIDLLNGVRKSSGVDACAAIAENIMRRVGKAVTLKCNIIIISGYILYIYYLRYILYRYIVNTRRSADYTTGKSMTGKRLPIIAVHRGIIIII